MRISGNSARLNEQGVTESQVGGKPRLASRSTAESKGGKRAIRAHVAVGKLGSISRREGRGGDKRVQI